MVTPKQINKMIHIGPGRWASAIGAQPPEVTLAQWCDAGSHWELRPYDEPLVRVDTKILRLLGMTRSHLKTLRRLGETGFIECFAAGPHFLMLNLASWANHLRRCAEDPYFWAPGRGNIEAYRNGRDGGRYARQPERRERQRVSP